MCVETDSECALDTQPQLAPKLWKDGDDPYYVNSRLTQVGWSVGQSVGRSARGSFLSAPSLGRAHTQCAAGCQKCARAIEECNVPEGGRCINVDMCA